MNINGVKVTERGWAGHFCCSHSCMFRRNTLLEYGDKHWVVSTVGRMRTHLYDEAQPIGADRYYETMAFEGIFDSGYWEADVRKEIEFNSKWKIDSYTSKSDMDADNMHEAVVEELIEKIKNI